MTLLAPFQVARRCFFPAVLPGIFAFLALTEVVHPQIQTRDSDVHQCICNGRVTLVRGANVNCKALCVSVNQPRVAPPAASSQLPPSEPDTAPATPSPAQVLEQRQQELRERHRAEEEREQQAHRDRLAEQAARDQQEFERRKQSANQQLRLPADGASIHGLKPAPSTEAGSAELRVAPHSATPANPPNQGMVKMEKLRTFSKAEIDELNALANGSQGSRN